MCSLCTILVSEVVLQVLLVQVLFICRMWCECFVVDFNLVELNAWCECECRVIAFVGL